MKYFVFISLLCGFVIFLFFNTASIISIWEKEKLAAKRFFYISWLILLLFSFPYLIDSEISSYIAFFLLLFIVFLVIVLAIPLKGELDNIHEIPINKHDERDTMFSRNELVPGSDRFNNYYQNKPKNKSFDDKFRTKPGLLSPMSKTYDPLVFAAANASFYTVSVFKDYIDGEINENKTKVDPKSITKYIYKWSKKLGAVGIGATELKPYHLYSIKGRNKKYGKKVVNNHKYAIAFTVEMDTEYTEMGPQAPIVMESAQKYLSAGIIAVQIAQFIRQLGYPARAHIDGNYRVVCPLVAKDAGLGEIGRMGLLMTPKQGPRVRVAVITTDIDLLSDDIKEDKSMIDFCEQCKKCAHVCPSNSISEESRIMINGVKRWQINSDTCFNFWCKSGTDCGRCMATCPYSHPDNLLHNIIRYGIRNNFIFRKLALYLDDYFYGKIPLPAKIPQWMKLKESKDGK
jgi:reductive dehalogenase